MNSTKFFSSNKYIFLPTSENPKVAIVVDSPILAQNSFKLYNSFSVKAKILKKVSAFVFTNFNGLSKLVWGLKQEEKSAFVSYLEAKLNKSLVSSLYFSTIQDKVVIQLQTSTAEIVGYLKYPLNEVGFQHLKTEKNAIELLSEQRIVNKYLLHDEFNGKPFILLAALEGRIGIVPRNNVDDLLLRFRRKDIYKLTNHPRIIELKRSVISTDMSNYLPQIEKICQKSILRYALVYEHGDFTPWNIVKVDGDYVPFDFEHFVEDGLEYFDLIKYYYQIGRLLEGMKAKELITYISEQINIKEIESLFQLFLIKEISRNKEESEPYFFEINVLETMEKR
jgi:hypothetical protein